MEEAYWPGKRLPLTSMYFWFRMASRSATFSRPSRKTELAAPMTEEAHLFVLYWHGQQDDSPNPSFGPSHIGEPGDGGEPRLLEHAGEPRQLGEDPHGPDVRGDDIRLDPRCGEDAALCEQWDSEHPALGQLTRVGLLRAVLGEFLPPIDPGLFLADHRLGGQFDQADARGLLQLLFDLAPDLLAHGLAA